MAERPSLPPLCIALGFPSTEKLLEQASREALAGETFLEFRLDHLSNPAEGTAAIRAFRAQYPGCSILATCRRHQNHGKFNGSIAEEVRILLDAVSSGARAVDLEIESAETAGPMVEELRSAAFLIVSYHNFDGTPSVDVLVRRMSRVPADAYKIVTTARKPSDNFRVLSIARGPHRVPVVVLAMGEAGFPTRVLSPAFGGLFTYAAPIAAEGTAPGQISSRRLRNEFRLGKFTRDAHIYGVIADPVRHSLSPQVHNRAFQARRMDAVYLPFLVKTGQLRDFFVLARQLPIAGASVTIPHKQKVMRCLDAIDPLARRIGAVNTVWRKAGKWRGANTDAQGVLKPMEKRLRLAKSSVLLVGNGGAARGAAYAMSEAGAKLSIVGRNIDRVRALAKACDAEVLSTAQLPGRRFDALVHATPLGMSPHTNECFFEGDIPADVVLDMVYNPLETVLLRRAREQHCEVIPGIEMFIEQAAQQFEIWTGETAPRAVMEKAAVEALTQPHPAAG